MDKTVTTDGMLKFSETCVLTPSLLARRLRLDDSTIEQIQFSNPTDRHEQIYQMLLKWKQNQPNATWKDLQEATDSGVKRALSDIEDRTNGDSSTTPTGHDKEREEYGPPASKVVREDSPLPSAPPFDLIDPVQEESNDDNVQYTHSSNITMNYHCMNGNGVISAETNHEVNHDQDKELTCKYNQLIIGIDGIINYLHAARKITVVVTGNSSQLRVVLIPICIKVLRCMRGSCWYIALFMNRIHSYR